MSQCNCNDTEQKVREMARYGELNRMFADKLNVRGHETVRKNSVLKHCLKISSDGADATDDCLDIRCSHTTGSG